MTNQGGIDPTSTDMSYPGRRRPLRPGHHHPPKGPAVTTPPTRIPQAWADLIEALTILADHQANDIRPTHCEHDTLTVMADPATVPADQLARLEQLGFHPDHDNGTFSSYRFGSA